VRVFRRLAVGFAAVALGSTFFAAPAQADGGNTNGFWQYIATYPTSEQCNSEGARLVPADADGWACSTWSSTGTTNGWNLYFVFAS
jgi:hypothetical protein